MERKSSYCNPNKNWVFHFTDLRVLLLYFILTLKIQQNRVTPSCRRICLPAFIQVEMIRHNTTLRLWLPMYFFSLELHLHVFEIPYNNTNPDTLVPENISSSWIERMNIKWWPMSKWGIFLRAATSPRSSWPFQFILSTWTCNCPRLLPHSSANNSMLVHLFLFSSPWILRSPDLTFILCHQCTK